MARKTAADQYGAEAMRRLLCGLARGDDVFDLAAAIEELHPRRNTFTGQVFMRLSAGALEVAGVGQHNPIPHTGLGENTWASASSRGGRTARSSSRTWPVRQLVAGSSRICPARVTWWQADDFWWSPWPPRLLSSAPAPTGYVYRRRPSFSSCQPGGRSPRMRAVWARRALTRCRRCRRPALFPARDWQHAGTCGAGR
jgi:hypothetical protein